MQHETKEGGSTNAWQDAMLTKFAAGDIPLTDEQDAHDIVKHFLATHQDWVVFAFLPPTWHHLGVPSHGKMTAGKQIRRLLHQVPQSEKRPFLHLSSPTFHKRSKTKCDWYVLSSSGLDALAAAAASTSIAALNSEVALQQHETMRDQQQHRREPWSGKRRRLEKDDNNNVEREKAGDDKDGEDTTVVYMIVNPNEVNALGKFKRYIGRTKCFRRRMREHQSVRSQCRLIRDAIQKYGFLTGTSTSHPMVCEILVAGGEEDMRYCESLYIEHYQTIAPFGYNMRVGDTVGLPRRPTSLVPLSTVLGSLPNVTLGKSLDTTLQNEATILMLEDVNTFLSAPEPHHADETRMLVK